MNGFKQWAGLQLRHYRRLAGMLAMAAAIGVASGVLDAVFGRVINLLTEVRVAHLYWLLPFLPLVGVLIILTYHKLGPECQHGMGLVFDVGRGELHDLPLILIPLAVCSTWLTHLFGGSVGREGVAVQMCATVANRFARRLPERRARRNMLITGIAAGFAGLFRTPMAAVFFAMELFHVEAMEYSALLPALVASVVASAVSGLLGLGRFSGVIAPAPAFSVTVLAKLSVLGILCGLVGALFANTLHHARSIMAKRLPNPYLRIAAVGGTVAVLGLFTAGRYNGIGEVLADSALAGGTVYGWDWLLKLAVTVLCLSAGYQGGEVMPLFTIGATLGAFLGPFLGLPPTLAAALAYVAVFGAGTNTFIAAIMVGAELFGADYLFYFVWVCALAYASNGNKSIYPQFRMMDEADTREALGGEAPAQSGSPSFTNTTARRPSWR